MSPVIITCPHLRVFNYKSVYYGLDFRMSPVIITCPHLRVFNYKSVYYGLVMPRFLFKNNENRKRNL